MKRDLTLSGAWLLCCLLLAGGLVAQPMASTKFPDSQLKIDYKGSKVLFHGNADGVTKAGLLAEAKLIDIADRRFESKWQKKD